ncbi:hypothetical protein [Blastococcus aurantiacus]|uniref:hypothetical protein n=1 Tax=Blastococcus aurantiacus TaxID=1550231 RepID=UPI00115FFBD8|nr:hypothetical protein [Blastococcus aurantiacus]
MLAKDTSTDDRTAYRLPNGLGDVEVDRARLSAHFRTTTPLPHDHLVHPHIARVAAIMARWLGWQTIHAGAFEYGGGAWGVLGERNAGKSSLMAQLHVLGLPIITDDVVVVQDGMVIPGPGLIDLREGAAAHFGFGTPLGVVGRRARWRVPIPPTGAAPLRGWILPTWGEAAVTVLPLQMRVPLLASNLAVPLPPTEPAKFFSLAGVPILHWSRRQDWSTMESSTCELLDALSS